MHTKTIAYHHHANLLVPLMLRHPDLHPPALLVPVHPLRAWHLRLALVLPSPSLLTRGLHQLRRLVGRALRLRLVETLVRRGDAEAFGEISVVEEILAAEVISVAGEILVVEEILVAGAGSEAEVTLAGEEALVVEEISVEEVTTVVEAIMVGEETMVHHADAVATVEIMVAVEALLDATMDRLMGPLVSIAAKAMQNR